MAVSFSSISGRVYPAWQSAFQASLEESILNGSEFFNHLWKSPSCMAVSFSSISGRAYPAWQWAYQASLEESILHGSQLLKHLWKSLSCMAVRFYKHLWKSLSCMAVSFSSISGRVYPAWQSAFQASLEESFLHGSVPRLAPSRTLCSDSSTPPSPNDAGQGLALPVGIFEEDVPDFMPAVGDCPDEPDQAHFQDIPPEDSMLLGYSELSDADAAACCIGGASFKVSSPPCRT